MKNYQKIINPHDEVLIDCQDVDAAFAAVIVLGRGAYGVETDDDKLPIFVFADENALDEWAKKRSGKDFNNWLESVSIERLIKALESVKCEGQITSTVNLVQKAKAWAEKLKQT